MKKYKILIVLSLFIIGCGSYQHSSYRPKIKSLLAITETGDTVSVSMREFERQKYDNYTRFNYNNSWYWNNWRYDFDWRWQQRFFAYPNQYWWYNNLRYTNPSRGYSVPSRPKTKPRPRPRPKVDQPRLQPRPRYRPNENRARIRDTRPTINPSNSPSRTPSRSTPTIQRTNVGRRGSSGSVRNKQ